MKTRIRAATKTKRIRKNGATPKATMTVPIGYTASKTRQRQNTQWLMPNVAAVTPQYIEMTIRGAMAGNHVQQWQLFDLMLKTWPELSQCYSELIEGVLRKKIIFEPFHEEDEKPSDNAIERMKLVSEAMRHMDPNAEDCSNSMEGTVRDILDAWFRGVAVLEISWPPELIETKSLGLIMAPKCTHWVNPTYYAFDGYGTLGLRPLKEMTTQATTYLAPQTKVEPFPDNKFLIAIHKSTAGTVLGGPLLVPLAWWWCAANFSSDWLLNLAQVFGLPFRWATYDPNAPQATIDAVCNMLQNMGSAGWAAFPTGTEMELKEGAAKGGDHSPQGELLDRADRYARSLILGQTMTGTHGTTGKGGGQAFGEVESDVKADRIDAAGKFAAEVINRQLVNSILLLNYGDAEEAPAMRFLEEDEGKLEDAQRDTTLATGGLKIGVEYLRKKYGIPEPAEDEETIGGAPPLIPTTPFSAGPGGPSRPNPNAAKPSTGGPPPKLKAKLERLSAITDDALFAAELENLANE